MPESTSHDILLTLICAASGGVGLMALARRLKVPAIVLLLAAGVVLGPEVLGWVKAESLGGVLPVFVSMAVGIILFEGGITLDVAGYRQAGTFIRRLISWGVLVTWVLATAGRHAPGARPARTPHGARGTGPEFAVYKGVARRVGCPPLRGSRQPWPSCFSSSHRS